MVNWHEPIFQVTPSCERGVPDTVIELRGLIRSAIDEFMAAGDVVILAHAASHSLAGRERVSRVRHRLDLDA